MLDEAIHWQLCLGSGEASAQERAEFNLWHAASPEHAGQAQAEHAAAAAQAAARGLQQGVAGRCAAGGAQ
ncbi:FecR/PupR family sigma factor regulator, partial [Metapseudomonas otitidis]|uniref:FecR/PupR family sigma factor regulator n=1 Tax=Metapseudomonas otitidis TaxID=319939 RepID=UPI00374DE9C1